MLQKLSFFEKPSSFFIPYSFEETSINYLIFCHGEVNKFAKVTVSFLFTHCVCVTICLPPSLLCECNYLSASFTPLSVTFFLPPSLLCECNYLPASLNPLSVTVCLPPSLLCECSYLSASFTPLSVIICLPPSLL